MNYKKRYNRIKAEWMAIKKEMGTIGFVFLILSMIFWLIFGITTLCKTLQVRFSPQEIVLLNNVIFFVYSLILIGFFYLHVLKIKNRKLRLK